MGAGPCCGFCYMCVTDDEAKDSIIPEPEPLMAQDRKRQWCVDDSATERVFIPDASRNKYVVVGLGGATIRMTARLESPVLKVLPQGTIVVVSQVRSRRAHIVKPMDGWASLQTESGYVILEAIMRPTKYKVVFREGIFVRSKAHIEEGRIVRIAPFGSILQATGKTEIYDAVERIQVEDGWVSMRLREDKGSGAPLLMALN